MPFLASFRATVCKAKPKQGTEVKKIGFAGAAYWAALLFVLEVKFANGQ